MKKIFLTIAIIASSLGAFAQTDNKSNNAACANTEQTCNKDKKAECKANGKKCNRAFEGITLTDDQQNRLSALRENFRKEREANRESLKASADSKDKKDLTKDQKLQIKQENKARREEGRKKYLSGVKEILNPDQYVVFLENTYIISGDQHNAKGHAQNMRKDDRKDKHFGQADRKGGSHKKNFKASRK